MDIRCVRDLALAEPFRDAMMALNFAATRPDPFSTYEFYRNYLHHRMRRDAGTGLRLLLAFDGEELVGYLALKRSTHRVMGLRVGKLDLLTAHQGDRPQIVARPERAAEVSASIYAHLMEPGQDWSMLEFQEQEQASNLQPSMANAARRAGLLQEWPSLANCTIRLHWPSLAAYFAALSKKARSNTGRQVRTLLAAGDVQVLTSTDTHALSALFELYRGIETHSWKAQTEAAIGRDRPTIDYYTGLMEASQPMRVGIQLLLLDGVPIAGLISGSFDKGMYALHTVYDDRHTRLSPGSTILLLGIRAALLGGFEYFNLLRGHAHFKERWLAEVNETHSLQIYRVGTPFYWRRRLGDLGRRWLRRLQRARSCGASGASPLRHAMDAIEPLRMKDAWSARPATVEQDRCAALVAAARQGRVEVLTATQFAAAMPFSTLAGSGPIDRTVTA